MTTYQRVKGARVLIGDEAEKHRWAIGMLIVLVKGFHNAQEIVLPTLDHRDLYEGKLGDDLRMYELTDA